MYSGEDLADEGHVSESLELLAQFRMYATLLYYGIISWDHLRPECACARALRKFPAGFRTERSGATTSIGATTDTTVGTYLRVLIKQGTQCVDIAGL